MIFMEYIGDHMNGFGMNYGRNVTRAHKSIAQALWKILLSSFLLYITNKTNPHSQILNVITNKHIYST